MGISRRITHWYRLLEGDSDGDSVAYPLIHASCLCRSNTRRVDTEAVATIGNPTLPISFDSYDTYFPISFSGPLREVPGAPPRCIPGTSLFVVVMLALKRKFFVTRLAVNTCIQCGSMIDKKYRSNKRLKDREQS